MISKRPFKVGDFVRLGGGIYKIEKINYHANIYDSEVFVTHFSGPAHSALLERSGPWRSSNFRLVPPPIIPPLREYE